MWESCTSKRKDQHRHSNPLFGSNKMEKEEIKKELNERFTSVFLLELSLIHHLTRRGKMLLNQIQKQIEKI